LHLIGRWRLKQRTSGPLVAGWRTACYLAGLLVVAVALMSPIDLLASQYFYMHMIQHLLLVMIAPVLLWIPNPMPFTMWGLPATLRHEVGRLLRPGAAFRRAVAAVTTPGLVWLYFVATLVGWHDAHAYNAALENDLIHDLEHITFFGTAVLFWWHVIGAAPNIHRRLSRGVRIGYVLSVVPANALTGIAIAFATKPIYPHYTQVARPGRMTVMQDQMLSGILMWIPGSMMYIMAALVLVALILRGEDQTEAAPRPAPTAPPAHG
jgi:cytochrome c oxidase assembly factor CtaG